MPKPTAPRFRVVSPGHHALGDTGVTVRSRLVWSPTMRRHDTVWDVCRNGNGVESRPNLPAAKRAARDLVADHG